MRISLQKSPTLLKRVACVLLFALTTNAPALSQPVKGQSGRQPKENKAAQPALTPVPTLKRTTTRREVRRLGYGGSVTIYGAPNGSVTIEAWSKSEVEVTAEVEQSADTEENLTRLAALNSFILDEDMNHLSVMTVGLHDRKYVKRVARDLPKNLLTMPWKIDYHLKVPAAVDLEIYTGRGALSLSGVEGSLRVNAGDGAADFTLAGGDVEATLRSGPVVLRIPARNWRGRGISLRLASGDLTIELPAGFSGDIDAEVLRTGRVENNYAGLAPREQTHSTERSLQGRAGQGGAMLSFTVGDGTLRIVQASKEVVSRQ
ncbi:MAG: hypothetical protein QOH51_837 [Acidobacteriota bacterium]|jgi:hypothetical protein|nr:hypothetical protein [Acidobacteriota bacterium]